MMNTNTMKNPLNSSVSITLAFDIYGTLIDPQGIIATLREMIGDKAKIFSLTWREKQLEYTFRRGLMKQYKNFTVCTRHALDYSCAFHRVNLSQQQKDALLENYASLPAFKDIQDGLKELKANNYRIFAFSNGTEKAVEALLVSAKIRDFFLGIVSVDDLKSFKPNPAVYHHFLRKTNTHNDAPWLISSNAFDVIGAISAGMRAAWVQRSPNNIFDPWEIQPTITVKNLTELSKKIAQYAHQNNT